MKPLHYLSIAVALGHVALLNPHIATERWGDWAILLATDFIVGVGWAQVTTMIGWHLEPR